MASNSNPSPNQASSFPSRSSSSTRRGTYDVFLSFRGEDTRKNFTDHLYYALIDAGINAFRDDNELRRGQDISTDLLKAIQESRISIIVFSEKYANSRWCLEELVNIMECRKMHLQMVLPIFYNVDRSCVREQTGSFADAFLVHERKFRDEEEMARWKTALTEAASLTGWDLSTTCDGHEARFIKKIVEQILHELNHTYLHVANHPVGLDSHVEHMNSLLSLGSDDVRILGICGIGGMGKTTVAKAVFNQFFHSFDGKCFLQNVREIAKQPDGLIRLQEQLLSDILKMKKIKVGSVDRGINVIKQRLCNRKVLVVLDDVDDVDQLNAIARKHDWFGLGSRIIITTRDEHLLKVIEVDAIFRAEVLNNKESLELFSWHAFGKTDPMDEYAELSKDLTSYSEGLPLALEVLGSFLQDKKIPEWKDALEKLKSIPHDQIRKKLRISFEKLEDDKLKDIFLDISCFFIGTDKDYAIKILDACGLFATIGLGVLIRRCLVTIDEDNKLRMHDMLRDMGRDIVREESYKHPEKRSRLWFLDDVLKILENNTGTDSIEGLTLNMPRSSDLHMRTEAFAKMQNLRLLQLNHVRITGDYKHFSKELRWLCWCGFPLKYIPRSFYQGNLVAIDMRYSNLTRVWRDTKVLDKLKVLNLSHSHYLARTPNFILLPNLEKLILKNCKSLVEVHESIGSLRKLVQLNVKDCPYLKNLPGSICKLRSLEILNLSGCSTLDKLPQAIGDMESLTKLLADATAVRQVPFSIVRLKALKHLSFCGCRGSPLKSWPSLIWSWLSLRKNPDSESHNLLPPSLSGLSSLRTLSLKDCNLPQGAIPNDLGSLSSLEDLDLSGNDFLSLPDSISHLSNLKLLQLNRCARLQSLPQLPAGLETLYAEDCTSLQRLSTLSNFTSPPILCLRNCNSLVEVPGLEKLQPRGLVRLEGCYSLSKTFKETLLLEWSKNGFGGIFLPEKDIPGWFDYQSMGSSLSFEVPLYQECVMKGFAICVIYATNLDNNTNSEAFPAITVTNRASNLERTFRVTTVPIAVTPHNHLCLSHLPLCMFSNQVLKGDVVDVKADFGAGVIVKMFGLHLVYEQPDEVTKSDGGEGIKDSSSDKNSMVMVGDVLVSAAPVRANGKRGHEDEDESPSYGGSGQDQQSKRLRY